MKLSEFNIGEDFALNDKLFRCTDIGSRVVVAVPHTIAVGGKTDGVVQPTRQADATKDGWLNGPPYAVQEIVFDEYDIEQCEPVTVVA